jgi:hypothetical protein
MEKFTYEQEKYLRELRDFRTSLGICSIICWIMTLVLIFTEGLHIDEKLLIPFGGIVMTSIFLYTSKMIKKIETLKSKLNKL